MCPINCPNRSAEPNCHNTCEDYLTYKAKIDERSKVIRENKDKEELVTEVRETNFRKSTKTKQREY